MRQKYEAFAKVAEQKIDNLPIMVRPMLRPVLIMLMCLLQEMSIEIDSLKAELKKHGDES